MERLKQNRYLKNYKTKTHTIRDFYLAYLDKIYSEDLAFVDFKTFKNILSDYFQYIENELLDEGREYVIPYRLGKLMVAKSKTKQPYIHFKVLDESGRVTKSLNEHSGGWRYRFKWFKSESKLENLPKYRLVMVRRVKRKLAHIINNRLMDYIEM
jgi:hypothetical protein